uniref:Uncharacterized protein n=1 Tax=Steinernema glaseri TaxID=37863 RepID=A0A1I7XZC3_9BILA
MNYSVAQRPSTSLVQERPLRRQAASLDDPKRVAIHVRLSSARHNSLPEIVFRSTIDQKPRRSVSSSASSKVTVEVSQKHISRTPATPKYLKSAQHRVVVLKGCDGAKKNLFIV